MTKISANSTAGLHELTRAAHGTGLLSRGALEQLQSLKSGNVDSSQIDAAVQMLRGVAQQAARGLLHNPYEPARGDQSSYVKSIAHELIGDLQLDGAAAARQQSLHKLLSSVL